MGTIFPPQQHTVQEVAQDTTEGAYLRLNSEEHGEIAVLNALGEHVALG